MTPDKIAAEKIEETATCRPLKTAAALIVAQLEDETIQALQEACQVELLLRKEHNLGKLEK